MRFADLDAVTLDAFGTLIALTDPVPALMKSLRERGIDVTEERVAEGFAAEGEYYLPRSLQGRDEDSLARLRLECDFEDEDEDDQPDNEPERPEPGHGRADAERLAWQAARDPEHEPENDRVEEEAAHGHAVLVESVPRRLSLREAAPVVERRESPDEREPGDELAGHSSLSIASETGAQAKCIPAAFAPSSSSSLSPMCKTRPGRTPSASSASRNGAGSGFALPAADRKSVV